MARSTTKNLSLEKTKQQFVAHLQERERSPHTIKGYVLDIDGFACWFVDTNGDELSPELITPIDLREYKQFLVDERELTPRSVNRKLATLKSYLSWAHHAGLIDVMPLVPKHVAYTQLAPRWLDRREQHRYLKAVHRIGKQRDIAIIEILRHTGVRRAEFCAERWIDVGITERKGKVKVRKGKGNKYREIPLNKDAREAYKSLGYDQCAETKLPIATGERGALTTQGVYKIVIKYARLADVEHVTPHTWRHTFCRNLIKAGTSLEDVANLAGHESLDVTRRYTISSLKDLERDVERIEEKS